MADLEAQLFASGLPVQALMEKAALAVSQRLLEQHGETLRRRGGLLLVGPGHNGGDGLVIARELHLAGVAVRIWSPFARHKPLTEQHLQHAQWLGIPLLEDPPDPGEGALWIDALLGIGQAGPAGEAIEGLLADRQRQQPGRLVAVDVPTGLCADSGRLTGTVAARASHTYTLGLLKTGLIQDQALIWVGRLERIGLGLPAALLQGLPTSQPLALAAQDLQSGPWPQADPAAGKYQRGRLLLVAGSRTYRGAAALCLAGARASGCGSVRAALAGGIAEQLWLAFPEVVVSQELGCTARGDLQLEDLQLPAAGRLDALLVGPGLGADAPSEGEVWQRLQRFQGVLVLDADGLNRLAAADASTWLQGRGGPTWLTPHRGEFNRLFPDLSSWPALDAATAAAQRSGCSVLLKGARSVVAAADGRCWQLLAAAAQAARAGLGDVLAGYAAGLAARGGDGDGALLALAALAHGQAAVAACDLGQSWPTAVAQPLGSRPQACSES